MKVLIDTHIFLWYISGSNDLSEYYKDIISDPINEVYLSVASIWECVVKQSIGKLSLPQPAAEYIISKRNEHLIESMSISESSFVVLQELPLIHKDPFDRIILSQAISNEYKIITNDTLLLKYPFNIFL